MGSNSCIVVMNLMILCEQSLKNMRYFSMVNIKRKFSYQATIYAMQIQEAIAFV